MDTCRSLTNDMAVIRVPVNVNEKGLIRIVSTIYMLPPMILIDTKSKGDIHKQAPSTSHVTVTFRILVGEFVEFL